MNNEKKDKIIKNLILTSLIILALLSFLGVTNKVLLKPLQEVNVDYLDESFDRALKGFLSLTALKAGLAVIEGSEVGVSLGINAKIQLGDAIQPVYDFTDLTWKALLLGNVVILGTKFLLLGVYNVSSYMFGTTFLLLFFSYLLKTNFTDKKTLLNFFKNITYFFIIATFSISIVLPISISASSLLSTNITQPETVEAKKTIDNIREELFPENTKGFDISYKNIKQRIDTIIVTLKHKTKELSISAIKIITAYMLDTVVFPLLTFALLFFTTRACFSYVINIKEEEDFKNNLKEVLNEYFSKETK